MASATKLATPHTIWGQSFDGTANVGGSLSGVEEIRFKLNGLLDASNSAFRFAKKGGSAQGIQAGNLLISNSFSDAGKVPANGIYSKGNIVTDGAVTATSFVKTGGTAKQFLKADGSVDSNSYLLSSAYTASDILTKIKTVDGAGSGLDADLLDGVHGSSYLYATCYCGFQKTGVLVKTDVPERNNAMFTVHINGNSYHDFVIPIDTYIQFYSYNNSQIHGWAAINNGLNFGAINVFMYEGYVCLWFPQPGEYMSFNIFVNYTNSNGLRYNRVISLTNTTMPTEGVTRLVTITPKQSALTTDLSNVLKEDVVDGPILEEIENLTKEELKAELLGDVDSKLVTKVDKVELDAALTAKQDKLVNSADVTIGIDNKLAVTDLAKREVFDDLWIKAAGSNGTVDHTHTEDGVDKPYYLNEVWMTYEEAIVVYNESYSDVLSLIGREIYGVTNFPPPTNSSALQYSNYIALNAKVINVGKGFLAGSFSGWLMTAPKLTKIIGDINLHYWNASAQANQYLKTPALTDVSIYHLHNNFSIASLKSISLSSMQYMVNNSTATSTITVTVHPDVYAKLTGDTTNAAAAALTAEELAQWQALVTTANNKHISFATA